MLTDQLAAAIVAAPTFKAIDNYARLVWRGLAEGHIEEPAAERLSEAIEARRGAIRGSVALSASKPGSGLPSASRRQVSPDKRKSIERRRRVACSGTVPGRIACHFTPGETAALTIIAQEVKRRGRCDMPIDKIAALAGVCRTLVQDALREARRLRLIDVHERRRAGQPSLTNVVTIIAPEWRTWLRMGGRVQKNEDHAGNQKTLGKARVDDRPSPLTFTVRSVQNQAVQQQWEEPNGIRLTRSRLPHDQDRE